MTKPPLEGIRVLDSTHVFGLPYAGALLADMEAEVIKIEGPGRPDFTRTGGLYGSFPENELGEDWWNRASTYNLLNRGKLSITLDLTVPRCRDLFRQLASICDVVMENYTPHVMRSWGLDYQRLRKVKPDIIMVSNTGYGHGEGPYSEYPSQATTLEATHGLSWITGYPGGPPSKVGASYIDFPSAWAAVFAIGCALRYRDRTGKGTWVDLAMYQTGAMFISEYLMDYMVNGRTGERIGNRHPSRVPQGCYPARGVDQWIALSVGSDDQWQALCKVMGYAELASDARFHDFQARVENNDELDSIIGQWTVGHDKYRLMHMLQAAGIPAGPVFDNRDTHLDPHFRARGFLESVTFHKNRGIGTRPFIGRPYKFSRSPLKKTCPAPTMGQHSRPVLEDLLGLGQEEYSGLEKEGIIGTMPTSGEPIIPAPMAEQVRKGRVAGWDPDYKEKLGIP